MLVVPLDLGIVVFERFKPSFWLRVGQAVYAEHMMKAVSHTRRDILATSGCDLPLAQCPDFPHCPVPLLEKKKVAKMIVLRLR